MHLIADGRQVEYLEGMAPIAKRYDAFLVDVWGVLHDSVRTYPGSVDCLEELVRRDKRIILLSNAARRASLLQEEFARLGITPSHYDQVVSSGELTWRSFAGAGEDSLRRLGERYWLLGSERYRLTEGLPLSAAATPATADFLLTIGVPGDPSAASVYEPVLQEAATMGLPMVCANPDRAVVRDGVLTVAPGALAVRYEELGGRVIYFGKPHRAVYEHCFTLLKGIPRQRIVAVGDALATDIAGASANGIDSVLVAGGIHAAELKDLPSDGTGLASLCRREQQWPTMVIKGFVWR